MGTGSRRRWPLMGGETLISNNNISNIKYTSNSCNDGGQRQETSIMISFPKNAEI